MFRFAIGDLAWLTVALGLAGAWWLENRQRERESSETKRLEALIEVQASDLEGAERQLLDKGQNEARDWLRSWAERRLAQREATAPKGGADEALIGHWEVVETIANGKAQDLRPQPEIWKITKGRIAFSNQDRRFFGPCRYTMNVREIDIDITPPLPKALDVLKLLYELKNGKLRIAFYDGIDKPRPDNFDALNDKELTVQVLKKVE